MTEDITSPGVAEPEVTVAGAAISDGAYTLFVADFSDTDTAWDAYQELKSLEDGATVAIDGVIVVKREADGALEVQKATDHSTRSGLKWGVVGGVVLGVIFPPSIIGSAAVLGAAGAAGGKLRQLHHRKELAEQLQNAIAPGHSGLVALVSDPGAVKIRKALERADAIVESAVDDVTARDIRAAAKDAGSTDTTAPAQT
jgi:uncharacterized membrane protein